MEFFSGVEEQGLRREVRKGKTKGGGKPGDRECGRNEGGSSFPIFSWWKLRL